MQLISNIVSQLAVACERLSYIRAVQQLRKINCKPVYALERMILPRLIESKKSLLVNIISLLLLVAYAILGGFMFLYFEEEEYKKRRHEQLNQRYECIDNVIRSRPYDASIALWIIQECGPDESSAQWNFVNSLLYGFGILTTLGYGKIETSTTVGKLLTVCYGFVGVPVAVIILTNFGLYLRTLGSVICSFCVNSWNHQNQGKIPAKNVVRLSDAKAKSDLECISPVCLATIVITYLLCGAIFMPLLNGRFEFVDGLYYSYICFTAIEFGKLVPKNTILIPIVILYMCIGLALSTIAVELGAIYVKKLYYYGRRTSNFVNVKIWFGSKQLQVNELLTALSQTIGISADAFSELDLEKLVKDAILVKEGKLDRVPQSYIFLEGIWPPALVPLFIKDGSFPDYVDADDKRSSLMRKKSVGFNAARRLAYLWAAQEAQEESDKEFSRARGNSSQRCGESITSAINSDG